MKKAILVFGFVLCVVGGILLKGLAAKKSLETNGVKYYLNCNYDVEQSSMDSVEIKQDMSCYSGGDIEVISDSDYGKLVIRDIKYVKDGYEIVFECHGVLEMKEGKIMNLENAVFNGRTDVSEKKESTDFGYRYIVQYPMNDENNDEICLKIDNIILERFIMS